MYLYASSLFKLVKIFPLCFQFIKTTGTKTVISSANHYSRDKWPLWSLLGKKSDFSDLGLILHSLEKIYIFLLKCKWSKILTHLMLFFTVWSQVLAYKILETLWSDINYYNYYKQHKTFLKPFYLPFTSISYGTYIRENHMTFIASEDRLVGHVWAEFLATQKHVHQNI